MWLLLVLKVFSPQAAQYAKPIQAAAIKYNFDPLLIAAVVHQESRFTRRCCFRGSYGLMQVQLKPRDCKLSEERAVREGLYSPKINIMRGVRLLSFWRRWWRKNGSRSFGLRGYAAEHAYLLHYNQGFGKCPKGMRGCSWAKRTPISVGRIGGYALRVVAAYDKLLLIKSRRRAYDRYFVREREAGSIEVGSR